MPLAVPFYPDQQWVVRRDSVIMPGKLRREPFTTWNTATDSVRSWGSAPAIFDRSMPAYSQGGEPSLAPYGGGWVAVFPADPALYVLDASGRPTSARTATFSSFTSTSSMRATAGNGNVLADTDAGRLAAGYGATAKLIEKLRL